MGNIHVISKVISKEAKSMYKSYSCSMLTKATRVSLVSRDIPNFSPGPTWFVCIKFTSTVINMIILNLIVLYQITLLNAVVVDPLLVHLRLQQTLQETVVKMSGLVAKSYLF